MRYGKNFPDETAFDKSEIVESYIRTNDDSNQTVDGALSKGSEDVSALAPGRKKFEYDIAVKSSVSRKEK